MAENFAVTIDPLTPCADFPPAEWAAVGAPLFPYALDSFQKHAVCAIARGENLLVTAKTGSGKTAVAEYQIAHSLAQGGRVFYTTPIKSLSNQKYADLRKQFAPASVGILTGDVKFAPDASIVVMTQEILRNRLFKVGTSTAASGVSADLSLDGLHAVVFDEAHYMFDAERGHAWEETLMLLPPGVRCILLSATMASPGALAEWLGAVRRVRTTLLSTAYRVVPLVHAVLDARSGEVRAIATEAAGFDDKVYRDWVKGRAAAAKEAAALQKAVAAADSGAARAAIVASAKAAGGGEKPKVHSFSHELNAAVRALEGKELLPAIFFVLSRRGCEEHAARLDAPLLDSSDAAAVKHMFDFHLHRHRAALEPLPQYHALRDLLMKGVAFHHSGVLPALKEIVELLFSRGYVKALFATETFAVGLNMPARTTIFLDVRKFDDAVDGMRVLRPDEYTQMAGRAGRRGKDTQGLALYLPAHAPLEPGEMKKMLTGALSPLHSRLLLHYDFVMRVLQNGRVTMDLLLGRSFWSRQQGDLLRALEVELAGLARARAALPLTDAARAECAARARTEDELKVAVNAERKAPQRALEAWKNTHVGPKWEAAWKAYNDDIKLAKEEAITVEHARRFRLPVSQTRLAPVVAVLRALGFIEPRAAAAGVAAAAGDGADDADGAGGAAAPGADGELALLSARDLTLTGVLATEVNEGHPLLLPGLFLSGILRGAPADEVVAALGFFIDDKEAEKRSADVADFDFAPRVADAAEFLGAAAKRAQAAEDAAGISSPPGFWELRCLWADVGGRWMRGETAAALAAEYELQPGNMLRGILKLANLLTEWQALAAHTAQLDVLDALRDAPATLLRDIACIDSLYLRL